LVGQPLCDHVVYLVHPTSPGGDWGPQQTAVVKRLSTQSLNVTFTAPCSLSPCLPLTRPCLPLTLTLTPGGFHADIVIGPIVHIHQSRFSETLTRLEMA
jgi:hypothetical protein